MSSTWSIWSTTVWKRQIIDDDDDDSCHLVDLPLKYHPYMWCYQIGHHLLVVIRVIDGIIFLFCLSFGSPVFFLFFSSININCMIHFLLDTMTTNMNLKKQNKTQENRQLLGCFFFSVCICICIYVIVNLNRFWYCFIFLFFFFIMMMMMSFFSILIYIWIVGVYFFLAKTESKSWNWYDFFFVRSFVCLFDVIEFCFFLHLR